MSEKIVLADGIELWSGDFRDASPWDAIDHIISDPPYEQISHDTWGSIRRKDGGHVVPEITFEGIDHVRADVVKLAAKHCSGWALFFCTTEGVAIWRDEIESQGLKYKTPCIWVKPDAMPKFNGQGPAHGHECIVTAWCGRGYSVWNGGGRRGVFIHNCNPPSRSGAHPTEKPISLMTELIELFTQPGQLVCDPFMGSGTTGIACIRTGRQFLGCEKSQEYFELAKCRLLDELSRPQMFRDYPEPLKQRRLEF